MYRNVWSIFMSSLNDPSALVQEICNFENEKYNFFEIFNKKRNHYKLYVSGTELQQLPMYKKLFFLSPCQISMMYVHFVRKYPTLKMKIRYFND